VAINTHPDLRAAFIRDESLGLTGRKLFEILRGFQPITPMREALRDLENSPSLPYRLFNENATGRAEELIAYPHLITQSHQQNLLLIIDVIVERQMTEFLPSLDDLSHDFASPQALPWQMTSEVQALKPEELSSDRHQRLSSLSVRQTPTYPQVTKSSDQIQAEESQVRLEDNASKSTDPELNPVQTYQESLTHQAPRQETNTPRQEISTPRQEIITSRQEISTPRQEIITPRQEISTPRQEISMPSNEVIKDPNLSLDHTPHKSMIKKSSIWDDYHPQSPLPSAPPLPASLLISKPPQHLSPPSRSNLAQSPHLSSISSSPPRSETSSTSHHRRSAPPNYLFSPEINRKHSSYPVQPEQEYHHRINLESSHPAPPKAPDTAEYIHSRHSSGSHAPIHDSIVALSDSLSEPINGFSDTYIHEVAPTRSDSSAPTHPPYDLKSSPHITAQNNQVVAQTDVSITPPRIKTRQAPHEPSMMSRRLPRSVLQSRTSLPIIQHSSQDISMSTDRSSSLSQSGLSQSHHISQQREAVDREHLRISSAQDKLTDRHAWLLNILMFVVFVLSLLLLREPVTQWLKSRQNSDQIAQLTSDRSISQGQDTPRQVMRRSTDPVVSQGSPAGTQPKGLVQSPTSNKSSKGSTKKQPSRKNRAASQFDSDYVMVKVNVNKATFFLRNNGQVICRHIPFCAIPINSDLMIRSQGYYEVYIRPEELNTHQGQVWMIKLEPAPPTH
jgi:hypothetical protein